MASSHTQPPPPHSAHAAHRSPGRFLRAYFTYAKPWTFGIVFVVVSILIACTQKLGTIKSINPFIALEKYGKNQQIPSELATAAYRVKHTAQFSLNVFESLTDNIKALRFDGVSYLDLWRKCDSVVELHRSSKIQDASRLAGSLGNLKDTTMLVQDGIDDVIHASWHAFSSINELIEHVHDEVERQNDANVVDAYKVHELLDKLGTASSVKIEDLITLIDKARSNALNGISLASEVRRHSLATKDELRKLLVQRRDEKGSEAESYAVQTAEEHFKNIESIQEVTTRVQTQLDVMRGHLKGYSADAANFKSRIKAMEILPLNQELRGIKRLWIKMQTALEKARAGDK